MRRKQDLFAVTAIDSAGILLAQVNPCNLYQLPGVKWALRCLFPGATITERYIGKGLFAAELPR